MIRCNNCMTTMEENDIIIDEFVNGQEECPICHQTDYLMDDFIPTKEDQNINDTKTHYTFYKGMKNLEELNNYIDKTGDCPECESFQVLSKGDKALIKGKGYIEKEKCDLQMFKELPHTLKECIT